MFDKTGLLGLQWSSQKHDCFTLVRDFYRQNDICEIRNYARPDKWWEHEDLDLYMNHIGSEGFEVVFDPRPGDAFLMAIGSKRANHMAIITSPDTILHHFYGRLSTEEPYRLIWRNTTVACIRPPNAPSPRAFETRVPFNDQRPPETQGVLDF